MVPDTTPQHGFDSESYSRPTDPRMEYEFPKSYLVWCKCGWKSSRRVMRMYAMQELADHLRLVARVGSGVG